VKDFFLTIENEDESDEEPNGEPEKRQKVESKDVAVGGMTDFNVKGDNRDIHEDATN
jgi:hypothetical protein